MECGIEYSDHRNIRTHNLAAGLNTDQVGRVVERRQRYAVLDCLENLLGDDNAVREELAAVYDAVADSVNLAHRRNNALFRIEQYVDNGLDRFLMGRHCDVELELLVRLVAGVGQHAVNTDTLAQALGHNLAGGGVEQLVLQRRTASVDNQNFHLQKLPHAVFGGLHKAAEAYIIMLYSYFTRFQANVQDLFNTCRETGVPPTSMCFDFAKHGRPKVPMLKLSPSQGQKTVIHAPGFFGICKANSIEWRTNVRILW